MSATTVSGAHASRPPQNGNLLRQRKKPDRLCMRNTLRALAFFASVTSPFWGGLHILIFFNSQLGATPASRSSEGAHLPWTFYRRSYADLISTSNHGLQSS
jgi:ABC-type dipeptide/oligopeptide/nickel transport system permease component